ncbi:MAG: hypothetical protein K8R31_01420 [Bacteroidales bacterium]|nr:hypothetical protein [Bacteroidales bacterium]
MKKLLFVLSLALSVFYANSQVNNVAVIAISANEGLRTEGFEDVAINTMSDLYMGQDFNITEELETFKTYLYTDLAKEFPFELMDEATVINNEKFVAFKDSYAESAGGKISKRLPYEGYSHYLGLYKKLTGQLSEIFPEADAFMVVEINFTLAPKTMVGESGAAGGKAKANISLYHKSGKRIMYVGAMGISESSIKVVAGQIVSDRSEIPGTLKEGSEKLYIDMKESLPKKIKKMEKKLLKIS